VTIKVDVGIEILGIEIVEIEIVAEVEIVVVRIAIFDLAVHVRAEQLLDARAEAPAVDIAVELEAIAARFEACFDAGVGVAGLAVDERARPGAEADAAADIDVAAGSRSAS
jgi:hypothetical protein